MISSIFWKCGFQPSSVLALPALATRRGGSPARRGLSTTLTDLPDAFSHAAITSRTNNPVRCPDCRMRCLPHREVVSGLARAPAPNPEYECSRGYRFRREYRSRCRNVDVVARSRCYLQNQRYKMCFWLVAFSDPPLRIGSRRVEIAQRGEAQSVSMIVCFENVLYKEFAFAVGINGRLRMLFIHRDVLRVSIRGAG